MKQARSAGVILYREGNQRRYLLLQHAHGGHWSFPKGQIKLDEDPRKAARRELFEETQININKLELLDGFQQKIAYSFSEDGELLHKEVLYFLGKTEQISVSLSPEHLNYVWLTYAEALNKLTYEDDQKLLRKAEEFLNSSLG